MRSLRNRLEAAWNVLRGRPTMYRLRTGPQIFRSMTNVLVIECDIKSDDERPAICLRGDF